MNVFALSLERKQDCAVEYEDHVTTNQTSESRSIEKMSEDLWGAWKSRALITAIELDVFTSIGRGENTVEKVAKAANASEKGIVRLLDVLVSMGYLVKSQSGYMLNNIPPTFAMIAKGPLWGTVQLVRDTWESWSGLTDAVRTGEPWSNEETTEAGQKMLSGLVESLFFSHYGTSRSTAKQLIAMKGSHFSRILDVGAGSAVWSIPFAQALAEVEITALDLSDVLSVTREFTNRFNVSKKYRFVPGDVREAELGQESYDLVLLGQVLHSIGAESSRILLKKTFQALRPGGMVFISETMPRDDRSGPLLPLLFGLNMLLYSNEANVFTSAEYRQWMEEAGFKKVDTHGEAHSSSMLIARK